jgi:hypothetical protein
MAWVSEKNSTSPDYDYVSSDGIWYQADVCNNLQALRNNYTQGILHLMNNSECINTYGRGNGRMSKWGNVLAVTKTQPISSNNTILLQFRYETYLSNYTGSNWVCDPNYLIANNYKCNAKIFSTLNADSWALGPVKTDPLNPWAIASVDEWPIDYCLAQKTDLGGQCQLQYSLVIMVVVMIANIMKFTCIVILLRTNFEPILTTIGDGIATFLERPDEFTVDFPFLTRKEARSFNKILRKERSPKKWVVAKPPLRWYHTPSRPRWFITLIL